MEFNTSEVNKIINMFYTAKHNIDPMILFSLDEGYRDYVVISDMYYDAPVDHSEFEGWGDEVSEKYCYAYKRGSLVNERIIDGNTCEYALVLSLYCLTQENDGKPHFDHDKDIDVAEIPIIIDEWDKMKSNVGILNELHFRSE
jgi:hypothetical protein